MRRPPRTSGDLIADRRFVYALDLAEAGDVGAAIDLLQQAIDRAPSWPAAWRELGRLKRDRFDRDGAVAAFRECLRLDPADSFGAILELARLGATENVAGAPPAYVEALFDAYAPDFDTALVDRLSYATPGALAKLLRDIKPANGGRRFARALDLGCGTGLAGEAVRSDVAWLEGVDVSGGMLALAESKGVYDSLVHADLLAALKGTSTPYDLILAADVFAYAGDLAPVIEEIARRLTPDGLAAFSVEKGDAEDWAIGESLRFQHSAGYIRRTASHARLDLSALEECVLRKDRGADVSGYLVVLRKRRPAVAAQAGFNALPSQIETPPAIQ